MIIIEEHHKNIIDFDNYLISNFGNVKNVKTNKIFKPAIASHGYYNVSIRKDKKLILNSYIN